METVSSAPRAKGSPNNKGKGEGHNGHGQGSVGAGLQSAIWGVTAPSMSHGKLGGVKEVEKDWSGGDLKVVFFHLGREGSKVGHAGRVVVGKGVRWGGMNTQAIKFTKGWQATNNLEMVEDAACLKPGVRLGVFSMALVWISAAESPI